MYHVAVVSSEEVAKVIQQIANLCVKLHTSHLQLGKHNTQRIIEKDESLVITFDSTRVFVMYELENC